MSGMSWAKVSGLKLSTKWPSLLALVTQVRFFKELKVNLAPSTVPEQA